MKRLSLLRLGGLDLTLTVHGPAFEALRKVKSSLIGKGAEKVPPAPATATQPAATPEQAALLKRIEGVPWYHTLDLGHGVITPGFFDHRNILHYYHLPESLAGMRVLDVATYNGFWAFEFERRGAAEVVGVDIEKSADIDLAPGRRAQMTHEELESKTGTGFEIAKDVFGSRVRREIISVYDLSPERLGTFDLVFCGDLMVHLSNPIRAMQRIRSVTKGYALLTEMYDSDLNLPGAYHLMDYKGGMDDYTWWMFSYAALEKMIRDAGFGNVQVLERDFPLVPRGYDRAPLHAIFKASA